jgi:putative oxidoreductase
MSLLTLRFLSPLAPLGWALVRATAGAFLAMHGWMKWAGGTEGLAKFGDGLAAKGVPMPHAAAYVSASAELVGGVLLVLGLLTRPAGLALAINMAVAILTTHTADAAFVGTNKGVPFEYPALLFAVASGAVLHGGGRCSVDSMIERSAARAALQVDAPRVRG